MTNADESVRPQVGSQVGISEFTSMLQLGLIRICRAYPYREMQIKKGGKKKRDERCKGTLSFPYIFEFDAKCTLWSGNRQHLPAVAIISFSLYSLITGLYIHQPLPFPSH